jgi:tetratricopeptide (TPR) repeat protein
MRWFVVMVSFAIASQSIPALAGNPLARPDNSQACEHLDRGNNLYDAGSFKEAIDEYKAGEIIESAPVFDYNLGQSHRQLVLYREALWHYDRFLHKGQPTGRLRDAVISFMAEMRAHLENKAQSMPPTGREPSTEPPPSLIQHPAPTASNTGVTRSAEQSDSPDWLGWSLTGSGVVALGVSGVLLYRASQLNKQGDSESNMGTRQHLYDQASSRNLAGAIVGITGAAMAAVGTIRLTLRHRPNSPSIAAQLGINGRGVFAAGSF